MPSVRYLAHLAGVSRTTVSLALRNDPSISLARRQQIHELAKLHGYSLDPVVSTLMNQLRIRRENRPSEKIAFITSWPKRDEWRAHYNEKNYYEGACERAAQLGYEVESFWAKEPGTTAKRLSKILFTRSIRGVIIAPLLRPHGHLSLDWEHFACATLSHTLFRPNLHRVAHFHFEGMILALRRLKQYGYRRIGYANLVEQDERSNRGWLASFLAYEQARGTREPIAPFLSKKWKYDAFVQWIKNHCIDAVLSNWPLILEATCQFGRDSGTDIGTASLDLRTSDVNIAGIDQQPKLQGWVAVESVVAQLQRNEHGVPELPRITQLSGVWRDGASILNRSGK